MYALLFLVPFVTLTCSKKEGHSSYDLVYNLLPDEYAKHYKPLFGKEFLSVTSKHDQRTLQTHLLQSDSKHTTKYYRSFNKDDDDNPIKKKHENESERKKEEVKGEEEEEQKDAVIDQRGGGEEGKKSGDRSKKTKNSKRIIGFGQIWIRKGGRRKLDTNSCKWMYIKPFCFMQKGYIVCSKKKKACKKKHSITKKEVSHRFLKQHNETSSSVWSGFDKVKLGKHHRNCFVICS